VDLYDAIFIRRSVRKYDLTPLDQAAVRGIVDFTDSAPQLAGQRATFAAVSGAEVSDNSAPHYLLAFSPEGDSAYANVGYVMQRADLHIQSLGLGSHWMAMGKPKGEWADRDPYCAWLAFGRTDEPARGGEADFKRLPIAKISAEDNPVARAARVAPSGMNNQPWRLEFADGLVRLVHVPRGAMKVWTKKKSDKLSLGIAARHVELALAHGGKTVESVTPADRAGAFAIEIAYR
jgi:hypothetical protein